VRGALAAAGAAAGAVFWVAFWVGVAWRGGVASRFMVGDERFMPKERLPPRRLASADSTNMPKPNTNTAKATINFFIVFPYQSKRLAFS
jgi:hypothetical protein